jgi:hypothetical protein
MMVKHDRNMLVLQIENKNIYHLYILLVFIGGHELTDSNNTIAVITGYLFEVWHMW